MNFLISGQKFVSGVQICICILFCDTNRWGSLELKLYKMEIHVFKKKKKCVWSLRLSGERHRGLTGCQEVKTGGILEVCV